jgi:hypothetical protein
MNTSVIIPAKIQNTAPKPTKSQLAEALLDRAFKAHVANEAEKELKRSALEEEGFKLVIEEFKKVIPKSENINFYNQWRPACKASVTVSVTSAKIKAIQIKLSKLHECSFDRDGTKKRITDGLKTPNPLLGNEDTAKALDALLATLMAPQTPALITVDV